MSTASKEIEINVGNLTVFVECEVSFTYSSRRAKGMTPAEEDLRIKSTEATECSYQIEGDEVPTADAHQYYKDFIRNLEQFETAKTLRELIEIHCEMEAEDIAFQYIQENR